MGIKHGLRPVVSPDSSGHVNIPGVRSATSSTILTRLTDRDGSVHQVGLYATFIAVRILCLNQIAADAVA